MNQNFLVEKTKKLSTALKEAIEIDSCAQAKEICENYQHVIDIIYRYLNEQYCVFNDRQRHILVKLVACINRRINCIKNNKNKTQITLNDLKDLHKNLTSLLYDTNTEFPLNITPDEFREAIPKSVVFLDFTDDVAQALHNEVAEIKRNGKLLDAPKFEQDRTSFSIIIKEIDIKNASTYIDPYIAISIRNQFGDCWSRVQKTPISLERTDTSISFECQVFMDRFLEDVSQSDTIYLEFYHFKPKKKSDSLRCYSIIERDEIKEGLLHLEIYKKPIDYSKKKLKLFENENQFMHVIINFDKPDI